MADERKPKQILFKREELKWLLIGVLYVMLITVSRIDLAGTALIIFGTLAGMGINTHGLKLVEINIRKEGEKEVVQ
jgi:hypothetical protein